MKKIFLCILVCCLLLPKLTACKATANRVIESDYVLTTAYNLSDLENFVNVRVAEKSIFFRDLSQPPLLYAELNERFPVEVLNHGKDDIIVGYTVYRVSEGGYYYVFFGHGTLTGVTCDYGLACSDTDHMVVFDCAYYGALNKKSHFKSLKVGESTAEDVLKIDPNAQFRSFSARGRISSSLIRNNQVVEISYTNSKPGITPIEPHHLVIKEIEYVSLDHSSSYFYNVLVGDLPK